MHRYSVLAIAALALAFAACSAQGGNPPGFFEEEIDPPTPLFVAEQLPATIDGVPLEYGEANEAPGPISSIDKIGPETYAFVVREGEFDTSVHLWSPEDGFFDRLDNLFVLDREIGLVILDRGETTEFWSESFGESEIDAPTTREELKGDGFVAFTNRDGWVSFAYDANDIREIVRGESKLLSGERWLLFREDGGDETIYELVDISTGEIRTSYEASADSELYPLNESVVVRGESSWAHLIPDEGRVQEFVPEWSDEERLAPPLGLDGDARNFDHIVAYRIVDDAAETQGFWQGPGRVIRSTCDGLNSIYEIGKYIATQCSDVENNVRRVTVYDADSLEELGVIQNSYGRRASRDGSAIISIDPDGGALRWTPEGTTEIDGGDFQFSSAWHERSRLFGDSLVWIKANGEPTSLPAWKYCDHAWASSDEDEFAFYISKNAALSRWSPGDTEPAPLVRGAVCTAAFPSPDLERGITVGDLVIRQWHGDESREAIRGESFSTRTWGEDLVAIFGREPIQGRDELTPEDLDARRDESDYLGWLYSRSSGEWMQVELDGQLAMSRRESLWTARALVDGETQRIFGFIDEGALGAVNLGPGDLDVLETEGEAWLVEDGTTFRQIGTSR